MATEPKIDYSALSKELGVALELSAATGTAPSSQPVPTALAFDFAWRLIASKDWSLM